MLRILKLTLLCSLILLGTEVFAQHAVNINNVTLNEGTFEISYSLLPLKTDDDEFHVKLYYLDEDNNAYLVENATGDLGSGIGVKGEHTIYWKPEDELEKYRGNMQLKMEADLSYTPVSLTSVDMKDKYKLKKPKNIKVYFKDGMLEGGGKKELQLINAKTGSLVNSKEVLPSQSTAQINSPKAKGSYYVRMVDSKGNFTNRSDTFKVKKGSWLWLPILAGVGLVVLIVELGSSPDDPPPVPYTAGY